MVNSIQASYLIHTAMRFFGLGAVFWAFGLLVSMCTLLHTAPLHAQTPVRYTATEYAKLDNPVDAPVIRNMNSTNEVAGSFHKNRGKGLSGVVLLANKGVEDVVGEQGAGNSIAYGINDQGEIAGAYNTSTAQRPFRSLRKVAFQELALLAGSNGGIAYAINEMGEAAGSVSGVAGIRPVWWNRRGDVQLLPSLGDLKTQALDLNDKGDIVGVAGDKTKTAVLWPRKGGIVSLGTLPGFTHSEAVTISENGNIAGVATGVGEFPNRFRAVLWPVGGLAIQDLGVLPGGTDSRARDINNRGEVVGTASSADGDRAFIWTASFGMLDLNTLVAVPGLVITDALSVNKRGDIVVIGHDAGIHAPGKIDSHEDHHLAPRILVLHPLQ